jgi:hypothetical protein
MTSTDRAYRGTKPTAPLAARIARHWTHHGAPRRGLLAFLGPGLITGASDDDPSGIATYSQVGAQFGYGMTWVMLFSYPLMAAIQVAALPSAEYAFHIARWVLAISPAADGSPSGLSMTDPFMLRFAPANLIVADQDDIGGRKSFGP